MMFESVCLTLYACECGHDATTHHISGAERSTIGHRVISARLLRLLWYRDGETIAHTRGIFLDVPLWIHRLTCPFVRTHARTHTHMPCSESNLMLAIWALVKWLVPALQLVAHRWDRTGGGGRDGAIYLRERGVCDLM